MVMINNAFPTTHKPTSEFLPYGFFSGYTVQSFYLKSMFEPGMMSFYYHWLFKANEPYLYGE
jgi:hypothetical protein